MHDDMPMTIQVSDKTRIIVKTAWDGGVDLTQEAKPDPDTEYWALNGGCYLPKLVAIALATWLLHKAGAQHMLKKQHQVEL